MKWSVVLFVVAGIVLLLSTHSFVLSLIGSALAMLLFIVGMIGRDLGKPPRKG